MLRAAGEVRGQNSTARQSKTSTMERALDTKGTKGTKKCRANPNPFVFFVSFVSKP
jgi:hypothetical protein